MVVAKRQQRGSVKAATARQRHLTREEGSCSQALICSFLMLIWTGPHHIFEFFINITRPPKTGWSAYWPMPGPVCAARTILFRAVQQTLPQVISSNFISQLQFSDVCRFLCYLHFHNGKSRHDSIIQLLDIFHSCPKF